ncbi:hypothetical protein [Sinorhizobium fredii]|uniref:hypothetical protein n=1 Tax=Rhizobium fredii TaxID=380 RepID=UPI003518D25C
MSGPKRRKAKYKATLIYADEPQLLLLTAQSVNVIAVAIPDADDTKSMFLAATLTRKDWQSYMDGAVDLRYLFTYPKSRLAYTFDLNQMNSGEVMLAPFTDALPEEYLPESRMFSSLHTEDLPVEPTAVGAETLYVDGEWDMPEFGAFYQRYSDVYSFIAATRNWANIQVDAQFRQRIQNTFRTKPFEGGFSYVHFFQELVEKVLRTQRLGLERISYASPGSVVISGEDELFSDMNEIIPNFLGNRRDLSKLYSGLYKYLSENHYLKMSGTAFAMAPAGEDYIFLQAEQLTEMMGSLNFETVKALTGDNALVTAKIILAFYRRLEEASAYFAQGRVNFTDLQ